jgi:hypothetical protein
MKTILETDFTLSACVCACVWILASSSALASTDSPVSGSYLEVRSCDVYTGPCFANGEMGLTGKEGILVWSIAKGAWQGTPLDGLKVIAVLRADGTLGDLRYQPRNGKAVLIVDARANARQIKALENFARAKAGNLIHEVLGVKALPITTDLGTCAKSGCSKVTAGDLVEISTRCLGDKDHVCGNEETFYPPLTRVSGALPAYTEVAAFKGSGLGLTWEATCQRSAFLAVF